MAGKLLMPFGKHKGTPVEDLPADYLEWLAEYCELRGELAKEVEAQINARRDRIVRRREEIE